MEDYSLSGPGETDNPSNDRAAVSIGSDTAVRESAPSGGDAWTSALNEDNRRLVENKGWQSPDDALKSYRELDEYRGRSVALPGDGATEEDWLAYRQKSGMPARADQYHLSVDGEADEPALTALKNVFHEAELDQRQAQRLFASMADVFETSEQARKTEESARLQQAQQQAETELSEVWGPIDGSNFQRNVEMARRAVDALGGNDLVRELRHLGVLGEDNQVLSPTLTRVFAEVGSQLFAEDVLIEGGDAMVANPFASETLNLAAQGELVTRDPARARAFIQAAGKRPESYGLSSH